MTTKAELTARMTAPGGAFEMVEETVNGLPMRVYKDAPASMRDVFLGTEDFADRDYLIYRDEVLTYADFHAQVAQLANYLKAHGIGKGDRVAVGMRNYPEWVTSFWAVQVLGGIVVALNAWWTAPELVYALENANAKALIADDERLERLAGEVERLGLHPVISVRAESPIGNAVPLSDALAGQPTRLPEVEIGPEDFSTILFTSGTTGKPKGAAHTQRNHITNIWNSQLSGAVAAELAAEALDAEIRAAMAQEEPPQGSMLQTFPFFHIGGMTGLYMGTTGGMKVAVQYRWDPEEAVRLIERHGLTSAGGVPTVVRQLLEAAERTGADVSSLAGISAGGASVPPDLIRTIGSRFEAKVSPVNGYGLTETTSAVITNSGMDYLERPDSVGRPVPTADVKVVDADGRELGDNEIGEVIAYGPNIIRGYWNNPTATAEAFKDGWFYTGDLGYRDAEGFYYVVDRKKDVIIRGGENVYCAEVEAALLELDQVRDCALVGVAHDVLGEEVGAIVQPASAVFDPAALEAELTAALGERLARFKLPTKYRFTAEELPRTATGKLLKRDLKRWFAQTDVAAG